MAITAKFEADFNQFVGEVKRADVALTGMGTSATKVTTEATSSFNNMGSTVRNLAGAFGVGLSIGAVVQFGRSVMAAGDAIQKMADQTGLSLKEVQQLQYVAGQSGTSIQSLVGAVQMLQQRLGDDSTGATGAMRKLNINLEAFKALSSYQQMTTLATAIQSIEDPTERASVAAALFGKAWKEILPAIVSGMKEVGDAAPVMSDAAVAAADRAGDALDRMGRRAMVVGGTVVENLEKLAKAFKFDFSSAGDGLDELRRKVGTFEGALATVTPPVVTLDAEIKALGLSAGDTAKLERDLTASAEASIKVHTEAAAAVEKQAAALRKMYSEASNATGMAQMDAASETMKRAAENAEGVWLMERDAWQQQLTAREAAAAADLTAQAQAHVSMGEGLIIVGEYANANRMAGAAATAATGEAVQGYAAVASQVTLTGDAIRAYIELQKYSAAANAILAENSLFTSRTQLERISQIPTGGGGGGGTTNNVNVNVSGVFDANAKRQLTEAVSEGLTRSVLQGTKVS